LGVEKAYISDKTATSGRKILALTLAANQGRSISVCNLYAYYQEAIAYPKESSHQGNTRILRGLEIALR
jgi:hypothetical protein